MFPNLFAIRFSSHLPSHAILNDRMFVALLIGTSVAPISKDDTNEILDPQRDLSANDFARCEE